MWLRLQKAKERQPERLSLKAAAISRTKPKANRTLTATAWRMLEAAPGLTAEIAAVAAVVPAAAAVVIVVAAGAVEGPVVVGGIVDAAGLARRSAEEQYSSEQRQFQAGTSTVFLVLQRQTDLVAARSREVRARADAGEAIANLDRATARTIEAQDISLR